MKKMRLSVEAVCVESFSVLADAQTGINAYEYAGAEPLAATPAQPCTAQGPDCTRLGPSCLSCATDPCGTCLVSCSCDGTC
jgi:hypothetical protein